MMDPRDHTDLRLNRKPEQVNANPLTDELVRGKSYLTILQT